MEAYYSYLNSLVNKNKSEFSQFSGMNWLNSYNTYEYQNQRDIILKEGNNTILYKGTKPFLNHISKGCEICGSGKWSCLFITNKCNASCFYCPTAQITDELPSTQGIDFNNANEYAEYIKFFNFKGISFSGGEPLLYFDRTLEFLTAVRKICADDVYIWMYTNGILADTDKLNQLAKAGLNEIRFDIGATGFNLDKAKLAKDIIPVITIEIPSVPEEKNNLIALLPKMVNAGVNNLNLHQLRLTSHNAQKLINRGYTILNAERPLVLESELTALEIIKAAKDLNINVGINYCSFHYKNRFQKAGYRRMIASKINTKSFITQNGYIRECTDQSLVYKTIKLSKKFTNTNSHQQIELNGGKYFFSESVVFSEDIPSLYKSELEVLFKHEPNNVPIDPFLFKVWQFEYIEHGLRAY